MRIYLRALELEDYKLINIWRNDNEIYQLTSGNKYYISSEYDKKWIEDKIFNNTKDIYLGICLNESNTLIGYLSINSIDWRNRKASWGGLIIGDKSLWNGGYATEAANLMVDHVFNELGLNCFYAVWLECHKASLRMGEKVGFKKEGVLRQRIFKSGEFFDQISMSMTRSDFEAQRKN